MKNSLNNRPLLKQVLIGSNYNPNHDMNPQKCKRLLKENETFMHKSIYPKNFLVKTTHSHKFKRMV